MHPPPHIVTDIQANIKLPRKEIIYTDGQTDGHTSSTTTIGSFLKKK